MSRIRAPPIGPLFQAKLDEAKEWLMREPARWNVIQDELLARRYKNNFYDEKEIARERRLYEAVAERFLLEDADFGAWQMARDAVGGRRRDTGFNSYVVEFVLSAQAEAGLGILSFYVTRNERFWFATPLAELPSTDGISKTFEVNAVQDALDSLLRLAPPADE